MTDRAVSSTLNYVMSLGIATLLTTGLLLAAGGFVENRQEQVIRSELEVIGEQVASDFQRADRLVTAGHAGGGSFTLEMRKSLPERITGSTYQITLETSPTKRIVLTSTDPSITVTVPFTTTTDVDGSASANGGSIAVEYSSAGNELVIDNV